MNIDTRFGNIEYRDEDVVQLSEGLIGFSKLTHFLLVCPKAGSHFRWLQSLNEPALAFLVTDPLVYAPNYSPCTDDETAQSLGITSDVPTLVYATVSIPAGHPEDMTLNLAAPIVINALSRQAKQIVLEDHAYTIKHRVFQTADRSGEKQAA